MNMKAISIAVALGAFALVLAAGDKTIIQAGLTGNGKGKAKFQVSQSNGGQAELEVEGEKLQRNTRHTVSVSGGLVEAVVTTDGFGRFNLARRYTARGIPGIKSGDLVVVRNASNVVVLSGRFAPR